ncbi:hypothetical protein OSB04_014187 [Centaurea solstitialis]|uniref:DUF155 domain-containing protein n=1 Tax=Centaurea solstitialis TaxID=347529 RepID=A0AA38W7U9_9ASTR|nr:hypothetical protein OSB04_014187 [Centaurea solstitialis]
MNTKRGTEIDAMLRGQAQILWYLLRYSDGMALRCCVELRIADIISNHGRPTTLSEIAVVLTQLFIIDTDVTLAPMVRMRTDPSMVLPLHALVDRLKKVEHRLKMTHGEELFDFTLHNRSSIESSMRDMACTAKITIRCDYVKIQERISWVERALWMLVVVLGVAISEIGRHITSKRDQL